MMQKTVQKFYQELAPEYDEMTRFNQRLEKEKKVLAQWVERYRFHSVLDAACGTGLHCIALSRLGIETMGADISEEMLAIAKKNARSASVDFPLVHTSLQELGQYVSGSFDAVFCLGNSLPHLLTPEDLLDALQSFSAVLNPGGMIILQLLNYQKILEEKNRIVAINRSGNKEFIRFYDFLQKTVRFNILSVSWENDSARSRLNSTELFPYCLKQLRPALKNAGFRIVEIFGGMNFESFEEANSKNLVLVAKALI